jgi:hypothetical protein
MVVLLRHRAGGFIFGAILAPMLGLFADDLEKS